MSIRVITIVALILLAAPVTAQRLFLANTDTLSTLFGERTAMVSVHGQVYQQGNALTNSFVNKFINGGFIDNDLKNEQSVSNNDNFLGAGFQFGMEAMFAPKTLFGSERYGWTISVSHHDDLSIQFGRDVFNTVFYGNKSYAGKTADFGNSGLRYQRFQQLNLGVFDKETLSRVSVGFVNGNQAALADLNEAEMYTAANGEYIELQADGSFALTDTAQTTGLVMNGIGAIVNFEWNIPIAIGGDQGKTAYLRVGAQNLGFIRWNNKTVNYAIDSAYHYEGFLIDDLTGLEDLNDEVDNVVDSLLPQSSAESRLEATPAWLYLSWFSPLGQQFHYELSLNYKINGYHLPEASAALFYQPNQRWMVGAKALYGGYGGYETASALRAGIFLSTFIGKNMMLNLESNNVAGWLMGSAYGRTGQMKLTYMF